MVVLYILIFFLVLGLVVCIHELGHFFWAHKAGILVNEFSFGMGPKLLSKKHKETYWSLRAFPIGGFCAMAGEEASEALLKPGDEVKLVLNEKNQVMKIILKKDDTRFLDLPLTKIEKVDLIGRNMSPLFINDYEVLRNATVVISKKEETQIAPEERNFFAKSVWQRFMVCLGGPLNNFLLAIVVFILMSFLMGVSKSDTNVIGGVVDDSPAAVAGIAANDQIIKIGNYEITSENGFNDDDVSGSIGYAIKNTASRALNVTYIRDNVTYTVTVFASYAFNSLGFTSTSTDITSLNAEEVKVVCEKSAALGGTSKTKAYQAENGLRNGDIVYEIDYYGNNVLEPKKVVSISNWNDVYLFATSDLAKEGGKVALKYHRSTDDGTITDGVTGTYTMYSEKLLSSQGYKAAYKQIGIDAPTTFNFFGSLGNGFRYFGKASSIIFKTLWLLITSSEVGIRDMGGFITILNQTASYAAGGFISLLYFIGLLSVNLGIVNLLPIPALDGGRILFLGIEGIFKKKINPKVETIIENVVFWLLMALIVYVLVQDVIRLVIQLESVL